MGQDPKVWSETILCDFFSGLDDFFFFFPAAALQNAVQAAAPVPSVPDRVQALAGSCVVIPCTFTPSDAILGLWRSRVEVRMSFKSRNFYYLRTVVFNSENKGQVSEQFQDRVSLFGHTSGGDCSLRVEKIQQGDAKGFEISLKRTQDAQWGKATKFTLEVLGESGASGFWFHRSRLLQAVFKSWIIYMRVDKKKRELLNSGPKQVKILKQKHIQKCLKWKEINTPTKCACRTGSVKELYALPNCCYVINTHHIPFIGHVTSAILLLQNIAIQSATTTDLIMIALN